MKIIEGMWSGRVTLTSLTAIELNPGAVATRSFSQRNRMAPIEPDRNASDATHWLEPLQLSLSNVERPFPDRRDHTGPRPDRALKLPTSNCVRFRFDFSTRAVNTPSTPLKITHPSLAAADSPAECRKLRTPLKLIEFAMSFKRAQIKKTPLLAGSS